jgi:L-seryl-tRNA(Ser) seleniumtransferase
MALLRSIPQVERALRLPGIERLLGIHGRPEVLVALRDALATLRAATVEGTISGEEFSRRAEPEAIAREVARRIARDAVPAHRRAINATGVILHTGLGRAVYAPSALRALAESVSGYCVVEVDLESGERTEREAATAAHLRKLTGAEAALVVNNNAAATLLMLASVARGKDVIVSRGQLVEIGGSYRLPDILAESGARLVEVGTTNRTYIDDYRRAMGPDAGLLLQVHTSNYEIRGFVHETPLGDLVALGRERGVPVASDLGSGCFVDLSPYGLRPEPLASDQVRSGADIVCFSGDKLLGGPQAGILLGRADLVRKARSHPLYRTVRVDKTTLILLEATLRAYRDPESLAEALPVLRAIAEPLEAVRGRASAAAERIGRAEGRIEVEVVASTAEAGSGSLPAQEIPSAAIVVSVPGTPASELALRLRRHVPPVFTRIRGDRVWIDFRTLLPGEEDTIVAALLEVA